MDPGAIEFEWHAVDSEGKTIPTGVYFYRIIAASKTESGNSFTETRKMLIMK